MRGSKPLTRVGSLMRVARDWRSILASNVAECDEDTRLAQVALNGGENLATSLGWQLHETLKNRRASALSYQPVEGLQRPVEGVVAIILLGVGCAHHEVLVDPLRRAVLLQAVSAKAGIALATSDTEAADKVEENGLAARTSGIERLQQLSSEHLAAGCLVSQAAFSFLMRDDILPLSAAGNAIGQKTRRTVGSDGAHAIH